MAIDAPCGACGQFHKLGDHLAGRRFRCKGCGQPVTAPETPPATSQSAPPSAPQRSESRPTASRRQSSNTASDEVPPLPRPRPRSTEPDTGPRTPRARFPEKTPVPSRRAAKAKQDVDNGDPGDPWDDLGDQGELIEEAEEKPAPVPKKKKKAKGPSSAGAAGLGVGGAAGGALLLACLLFRLVLKVAPGLPGGLIGGMLAGKPNWRVWNHPTARLQVELPNAPQSRFQGGLQMHAAEVGNRFVCGVMDAALPPQAIGIPTEVLAAQLPSFGEAISGPKARMTSRGRVDLQGCPGVEFVGKSDGKDGVMRLYIRDGRILMLVFGYDGTDYPEERARFFNSLRLQ